MKEHDNWRGETHIQKAVFFLQSIFNIDLGFNFILYKHGPFSFDLRDKLNDMLAERELRLVSQYPYGPSYEAGQRWQEFQVTFQKMSIEYENMIRFVAEKVGGSGVNSLEALSTALYFLNKAPRAKNDKIAKVITMIKPHIPSDQAIEAAKKVREILSEAESVCQSVS